MVEWNGIFRLFRFSGRYTHNSGLKSGKCLFYSLPYPEFSEYVLGRMESALGLFYSKRNKFSETCMKFRSSLSIILGRVRRLKHENPNKLDP